MTSLNDISEVYRKWSIIHDWIHKKIRKELRVDNLLVTELQFFDAQNYMRVHYLAPVASNDEFKSWYDGYVDISFKNLPELDGPTQQIRQIEG